MPVQVNYVTGLPFGKGKIGEATRFTSVEEQTAFAADLGECTLPLTSATTADCVDERRTIALGNGVTDPEILGRRVMPQLPGGLVLAVTKAAVAADLVYLKDVHNFTEAYVVTDELIKSLGFQDGGHKGCGASLMVEQSVADEIPATELLATLPALAKLDESSAFLMGLNLGTKRRRLGEGHYGSWTSSWHESYLSERVPQNFSILADDPADHETHGHHSSGIYVIGSKGRGFAKNKFIDTSGGKEAFAYTIAAAEALTNSIILKIGGSHEERVRMRLEFAIDAAQVLNQLVIKGHPVFAETT